MQLPQRSARILAIEDAREIALQWKGLLHDKVWLERTPAESNGVGESYAWIRFDINIDRRSQVSAARAAAVTWFALSCCPGYGGHENPTFWKGVFSDLVYLCGNRSTDQCISDAYGFFDRDAMDFPRFKLKVSKNDEKALLFCGDPGAKLKTDDKAKLSQILETLAPWIDHERTARRPEVSLVGVYSNYSCARNDEITKLESQRPKEWPLSRFISESNRYTGSGWPSPVFVVKELDIYGSSFCDHAMKRQWFHEIMQCHETMIEEFAFDGDAEISRDALAAILRDVLRLPGSSACARTTRFRLDYEDNSSLPALASALPMTTSIERVWIEYNDYLDIETIAKTSIVWIAYALLHPDTPTTPWRSLILGSVELSDQSVAALQAMSRGNNLMALLEGREPTSDGYYRARLAADAIVYDQPGTSTTEQSPKTALVRSDGNLEVEVCDVASEDPTTWGEWVAVIVPAYGLGRVQSTAVTSVVKRAPAQVSLTRLMMSASSWQIREDPNTRGKVLSVLGRRLVHLDIGGNAKFASSADLLYALSCCPSLESLAVKYGIDVWDSEEVARVLPHLRELEMSLRDTHLAAFDVPPSLHLLRINAAASHGAYGSSGDAIRHILMQPSTKLRVFHWRDGYTELYMPKMYSSTCFDTEQRLEALDIPRQCAEYVDTRLPAACAAAFLSTISHSVQDGAPSAMTRLDKWMTMSIVEFAGSRATRSVVIEPTVQEVVDSPHYFDPRRS